MLNFDLIQQARWQDLYTMLAAGEPSLAMRLLILNSAFLIYFAYRRAMAKGKPTPKVSYAVQAILFALNILVMLNKDLYLFSRLAELLR